MLTQCETDRFELQVGSALEYLHSKDVLHADVKPDNVLLDGDTNFYLTDFSLSMSLEKDTLRHADQIYALFYRPPVLFYNTAGHVPIPEYDYYALFLTLCFARLLLEMGDEQSTNYEVINNVWHFTESTFGRLMKKEFTAFSLS